MKRTNRREAVFEALEYGWRTEAYPRSPQLNQAALRIPVLCFYACSLTEGWLIGTLQMPSHRYQRSGSPVSYFPPRVPMRTRDHFFLTPTRRVSRWSSLLFLFLFFFQY